MGEETPSVSGTNCKFAIGADQREWRRRSAPFALLTSLTPTAWETSPVSTTKRGNYVLYKQNEYGQQINVTTNLLDKNTGKYIAIVVGWMVFPNGKIQLTTPFGGYAKQ